MESTKTILTEEEKLKKGKQLLVAVVKLDIKLTDKGIDLVMNYMGEMYRQGVNREYTPEELMEVNRIMGEINSK